MSKISSINFKKSVDFQVFHNSTVRPNYAIGGELIANRKGYEALKLKEQIVNQAIETYKSRTKRAFQAKSYEWSAVCNIKEDTTMADLEQLAKHFEDEYGFQCYQIAIHRDEGHLDDDGNKIINHHAHLEFITLDKNTGRNRQRDLKPEILRQIQTEVAEILGMERGVDKKISKRERIEPRKYAQMKEQERKEQAKLKAEHKQELEAKDQEIQEIIQIQNQKNELIQDKDQKIQELIQIQNQAIQKLEEELEEEKLSKAKLEAKYKKELEKELEKLRKNSKNQGYSKEYFREISKEKKLLRFKTLDEFNEWAEELRKKHTTNGIFGNKVNEEAVLKDMYKGYQELEAQNQELEAENETLKAENERWNELLKADPALKKAYDYALEALKNKNKPKTNLNKMSKTMQDQTHNESESDDLGINNIFKKVDKTEVKEQDQEQKNEVIQIQNQEQYQENMQNPNPYTTDDLLKAIGFKDDVSELQAKNTDKTEISEQNQENDHDDYEDKTQEDNKPKIRKHR